MLELILLTSFTTLGLFITGYGFILEPIRTFIARLLGGKQFLEEGEWYYVFPTTYLKTIWKPIWGCPPCMPSLWGTVVYTLFIPYSVESIYELPILILSSSALNFIIFNNFVKKWLFIE